MPWLREAEKLANSNRVGFSSPSTDHQEAVTAYQGNDMTYLRDHWHDIRATWNYYRYLRTWLRRGGNPDIDPS